MKKTYQPPKINKVIYNEDIMEGEVTSQSIGVSGTGAIGDTGFGGDLDGPVDAKTSGRFWDDEY